ncbi:FHA domain-containing protein [Streptomyces mirabilis]
MEYGNSPLFLAIEGSVLKLDPNRTYTMGRDPQSDVVLQETFISWRHVRIYWGATSWALEDPNSTNGTYGLGQRIPLAEAGHAAVFHLGNGDEGPELQFARSPMPPEGADTTSVTRIGPSSDNDLTVDVGTPHGTYVDGHHVERTRLRPDDTVTVGHQ